MSLQLHIISYMIDLIMYLYWFGLFCFSFLFKTKTTQIKGTPNLNTGRAGGAHVICVARPCDRRDSVAELADICEAAWLALLPSTLHTHRPQRACCWSCGNRRNSLASAASLNPTYPSPQAGVLPNLRKSPKQPG